MPPTFRSSRSGRQFGEGASRTRTGQIDHDVFEGLPIRRWTRQTATVSQEPKSDGPEAVVTGPGGKQTLPEHPMPRDSHLLTPMSRALLRAARAGCIYIRQASKDSEDEEKEATDVEEQQLVQSTERSFVTRKWSTVPKHLEAPEVEFLAKRRPGLLSLYGATAGAADGTNNASAPMRKTRFKKVDPATGNISIYAAWVPEGHKIEGEVTDDVQVIAANSKVTVTPEAPAPGTVIEGVGVVNAEGVVVAEAGSVSVITPPKRRPPPPKRKAKGFGKGRRKKVMFAPGDGADALLVHGAGAGAADGATGYEKDADPARMSGDQTGQDDDDDDGDEGEESDDGDGEDSVLEAKTPETPGPTAEVIPTPPVTSTETRTESQLPASAAPLITVSESLSQPPAPPSVVPLTHEQPPQVAADLAAPTSPEKPVEASTPVPAPEEDVQMMDATSPIPAAPPVGTNVTVSALPASDAPQHKQLSLETSEHTLPQKSPTPPQERPQEAPQDPPVDSMDIMTEDTVKPTTEEPPATEPIDTVMAESSEIALQPAQDENFIKTADKPQQYSPEAKAPTISPIPEQQEHQVDGNNDFDLLGSLEASLGTPANVTSVEEQKSVQPERELKTEAATEQQSPMETATETAVPDPEPVQPPTETPVGPTPSETAPESTKEPTPEKLAQPAEQVIDLAPSSVPEPDPTNDQASETPIEQQVPPVVKEPEQPEKTSQIAPAQEQPPSLKEPSRTTDQPATKQEREQPETKPKDLTPHPTPGEAPSELRPPVAEPVPVEPSSTEGHENEKVTLAPPVSSEPAPALPAPEQKVPHLPQEHNSASVPTSTPTPELLATDEQPQP